MMPLTDFQKEVIRFCCEAQQQSLPSISMDDILDELSNCDMDDDVDDLVPDIMGDLSLTLKEFKELGESPHLIPQLRKKNIELIIYIMEEQAMEILQNRDTPYHKEYNSLLKRLFMIKEIDFKTTLN